MILTTHLAQHMAAHSEMAVTSYQLIPTTVHPLRRLKDRGAAVTHVETRALKSATV